MIDMLTKSEFELLFEIYNHKGRITFKQQSIFINKISFYRAIHNLKKKKFIIATEIKDNLDKRIMIYEITGKGIELYKILSDENEY